MTVECLAAVATTSRDTLLKVDMAVALVTARVDTAKADTEAAQATSKEDMVANRATDTNNNQYTFSSNSQMEAEVLDTAQLSWEVCVCVVPWKSVWLVACNKHVELLNKM